MTVLPVQLCKRYYCWCSGEVSSDRAANCEMSRFGADCLEVVVRTDPGTDVLSTNKVMQSNLLSVEATHVGIGYIELDGAVWWTILAGSDSEDPVEATPEEEENKVVPVKTPGSGETSAYPITQSFPDFSISRACSRSSSQPKGLKRGESWRGKKTQHLDVLGTKQPGYWLLVDLHFSFVFHRLSTAVACGGGTWRPLH